MKNKIKTKSLDGYIEKRLTKEEIAEINRQADLEFKILKSLQKIISTAMNDYMHQNDIGFNEIVRRLGSSPSHVAKIQRGEANLTIASLAHLFALLGKEPKDIFINKI